MMQNLQNIINLFLKNYLNKPTANSLPTNFGLTIAKLIINLMDKGLPK